VLNTLEEVQVPRITVLRMFIESHTPAGGDTALYKLEANYCFPSFLLYRSGLGNQVNSYVMTVLSSFQYMMLSEIWFCMFEKQRSMKWSRTLSLLYLKPRSSAIANIKLHT
jgi:hypothetical protein